MGLMPCFALLLSRGNSFKQLKYSGTNGPKLSYSKSVSITKQQQLTLSFYSLSSVLLRPVTLEDLIGQMVVLQFPRGCS